MKLSHDPHAEMQVNETPSSADMNRGAALAAKRTTGIGTNLC